MARRAPPTERASSRCSRELPTNASCSNHEWVGTHRGVNAGAHPHDISSVRRSLNSATVTTDAHQFTKCDHSTQRVDRCRYRRDGSLSGHSPTVAQIALVHGTLTQQCGELAVRAPWVGGEETMHTLWRIIVGGFSPSRPATCRSAAAKARAGAGAVAVAGAGAGANDGWRDDSPYRNANTPPHPA